VDKCGTKFSMPSVSQTLLGETSKMPHRLVKNPYYPMLGLIIKNINNTEKLDNYIQGKIKLWGFSF
jgi:hypothetical protein